MLATGEDDHGPIIVELSLELFVVAKTRDMKGLFGWLIFELGEDCICSKAINWVGLIANLESLDGSGSLIFTSI